jgi:hypothetical protein
MTEYPVNALPQTERAAALQTTLDIIFLIENSSRPDVVSSSINQFSLFLSNSRKEFPNTDPAVFEVDPSIIEIESPEYVGSKAFSDGLDLKPMPVGHYVDEYSENASSNSHNRLLQIGITALCRGRSVLGISEPALNPDRISVYEKPIPDLPEYRKREIVSFYEQRKEKPLQLDEQLACSPHFQMVYPKRALAAREGFVTMRQLDIKRIPIDQVKNDALLNFLGIKRSDTENVFLPRLGSLYSLYNLMLAGFETRIVEAPNAFAIMARPLANR